jgi:hypothetical protein
MATFEAARNAALRREAGLWAIGDALLEECGPTGITKHREAQAELEENGFTYELRSLRRYRDTSLAFPPERRRADLGHAFHAAAGDPALLDEIVDGWAAYKPGERLTVDKVREVVKFKRQMDKRKKNKEKRNG